MTAMVRPPAAIAAVWAAVSMPAARPLTTRMPWSTSAFDNVAARRRPSGVAFRDPTTATRGLHSRSPSLRRDTGRSVRAFLRRRSRHPGCRRGSAQKGFIPCHGSRRCGLHGRQIITPLSSRLWGFLSVCRAAKRDDFKDPQAMSEFSGGSRVARAIRQGSATLAPMAMPRCITRLIAL